MKGILTGFAVFGLDYWTKRWANENLPLNRKKEVVGKYLYFWHIKNSGVAYNTFSGKRKEILIFTGSLLAYYSFCFINILRGEKRKRYAVPMAMILGGGYGNLWERAKKGAVTDFLFIPVKRRNAPIFNLADVGILIGAIWMTLVSFSEK